MSEFKIPVSFGNKSKLFATRIGKFKGAAISKDSKKTPILLKNVKYVPCLDFNVFSITKAMKVFELKGTKDQPTLRYKN